MYFVRASLDKAHVALVYLLVVLGASAAGGRALGLTVAGIGFLCFDLFFLPPYNTLTITNPLDWLVLIAFLVTSAVAAQLLYRASATAEAATQRAVEVDRLAALGAETLNAADADEALRAIADVIRNSVDADVCDIFLRGIDGGISLVARAERGSAEHADDDGVRDRQLKLIAAGHQAVKPGSLPTWIAEHGASAVELADGTVRVAHDLPPVSLHAGPQLREARQDTAAAVRAVTRPQPPTMAERFLEIFGRSERAAWGAVDRPAVRALALPLQVRDRTAGVLRIAAADELMLKPEQARLLIALAYYAALGAERARLVATAERAEAERRVESLRNALLTAVSHDLRTPLTTIKGIANEIVHGGAPSRAADIEAEADRLNALVSDLLDLSRIYAHAVRPTLAVNTVDDLLGAALRAASGVLRGRHVEVDTPEDELLVGLFDFTQSLRIVVNLLDNAAKYSSAGSRVDVRARRRDHRLLIDVMDAGPGVPANERERIFEPFYRPPGVPPDVRGHGLGLSIALGLAEAQGGSVRFAPRAEGGSVFTLELAAADDPGQERDSPSNGHGRSA